MSGVRLPDGFLEELKDRVKLSDVIGRKTKLKKQGKSWVGLSPFTNEKTPSFYVHDAEGYYKCFSSGQGGDIIKFIQETERLGFMEAVEKLADMAGMAMPQAAPEDREAYDRRTRLLDVSEAACTFFEDQLRSSEGAAARSYLAGRGLGPESWGRYRLGYAPDDWRKTIDRLKAHGFALDEIVEAGLAVQKDGGGDPYDRFRGRVIFPIEDSRGAVIAFGGRALEPDAKPKYLNSSDSPLFHKSKVLYRYKAAREALGGSDAPGLIVCEGYMDVIALCEAGIGYAVAPLGTALTEDQLGLLWRAAPEPVLCFDGDAAGLRAAYRSIDRALPFLSPQKQLFFTMLPEGLDPDDLIRQRGKSEMTKRLKDAAPLVDILWARERDLEPLDTPERQAGLEARLNSAANAIEHSGVKAAYTQALRNRARDYFWALRREGRGTPARGPGPTGGPLKSDCNAAGLGNILQVLDNPGLLDLGREELALANFADQDVNAIRDAILDLSDYESEVDQTSVHRHLVTTGNTRAAQLLTSFTRKPHIDPDGHKAREWLTALERFAADDDSGAAEAAVDEGEAEWADTWRRLHQRTAERRAYRARLNEAAEKSDQS
ncbi:MAG: DNA primase [Pseudomonadota bacterium]